MHRWHMTYLLLASLPLSLAQAASPSFDCSQTEKGSIEAMVCADEPLAALDHQLAGVYRQASQKARNEQPPQLKATQRGWIKGRNDCWKSSDVRTCVHDNYQLRIAELQARYQLLAGTGPVIYSCSGGSGGEVIATFYPTVPATLVAEYGDSTSLMYQQPSGSGSKYQGQNETFWEHQGEARVTWGYNTVEMRCKKS